MVKGRPGYYLEAWKFGIYLLIPITASWYYNDPNRVKQQADYWQLVKYPPNPNTNMKEKVEELMKQEEQRRIYREQLQELNRQAERTLRAETGKEETTASKRTWWQWLRGARQNGNDPVEKQENH